MAAITYTNKVSINVDPSVPAINKVTDSDMNEIKSVVNENETKYLLAVTDTAPSQCSTGDVYFDTTDNLLYTATATDTWSSTGVAPTSNTIYIVISTQTMYAYNGITLVSVGSVSGGVSNIYSTSQQEAYSCDYVNNLHTYSTTETRIGTWINSKPIYRKVVDFGNLPGNTSKSVNHDISNLDLIVNIRGISKNPTSGSVIPIPDNIASNIAGIYVDDTKIGIYTNNSAWTDNTTYIILEYTKSTD